MRQDINWNAIKYTKRGGGGYDVIYEGVFIGTVRKDADGTWTPCMADGSTFSGWGISRVMCAGRMVRKHMEAQPAPEAPAPPPPAKSEEMVKEATITICGVTAVVGVQLESMDAAQPRYFPIVFADRCFGDLVGRFPEYSEKTPRAAITHGITFATNWIYTQINAME